MIWKWMFCLIFEVVFLSAMVVDYNLDVIAFWTTPTKTALTAWGFCIAVSVLLGTLSGIF